MRIEYLYREVACLYGEHANVTAIRRAVPGCEVLETPLTEKPKFLDPAEKIDLVYMGTMTESAQLLVIEKLTPYRQEIIDAFEKAPAGTVLAAQIQSGGTGLNIQSASVVILCEPQLKPSIENQAVSRAYRMGQTRNVLVFRLLCDDTIDEKITDLLEEKQTVFDAFADRSDAAEQSLVLDEKSLNEIIESEIERINAKHAEEEKHSEEKKLAGETKHAEE